MLLPHHADDDIADVKKTQDDADADAEYDIADADNKIADIRKKN